MTVKGLTIDPNTYLLALKLRTSVSDSMSLGRKRRFLPEELVRSQSSSAMQPSQTRHPVTLTCRLQSSIDAITRAVKRLHTSSPSVSSLAESTQVTTTANACLSLTLSLSLSYEKLSSVFFSGSKSDTEDNPLDAQGTDLPAQWGVCRSSGLLRPALQWLCSRMTHAPL